MSTPSRFAFFLVTLAATTNASAAEICGNGIDDDADLLVDEQCYPGLTTGQCESPLSCADTGDVSPTTGSLRYQLDPDIAPKVPYGPGIGFRRFYLSQYAPGGGAPAYRKPMGERWGHTYMSWLDKNTTPNPDQVVVHLPRGQDAMFEYTSTVSGWDEYKTFQPGFHFQYLRQRTTAPNEYELKTLTGEVLVYNSSGKLTEIKDSMPAQTVQIAYDGAGMVSTVTDATRNRRLLFGYTSNQLTSIALQFNQGSWTTHHTTTYGYTSGNLTSVTIGGQLAQTNVYTSNYLTSIQDGGGKTLVNFAYDGATAGKVVRVDTPRGVVGYEFASSRANCSGKTVLFFHRVNTSSCNNDSNCGTGNLCGGKTGGGSTGQCFRGARCLTTSSPSEDIITNVSAFAGNSETCDGACLDAIEYVWNTSGRALDLTAVKDPSNNYTAKAFNANGLPTTISFGDPDTSAGNGNGTREVWLYYDTNFPGLLSEIRRKSDLAGAGCSSVSTTNCKRTTFQYTDAVGTPIGKLTQVNEGGSTYAAGAFLATYGYTTAYTYDTKGRLTQIDGPLGGTNDVTQFEYWSAPSDLLKDGFLQNLKRKKDTTNFLVQSSLTFDFWGNATSLSDADGTISCQTFDSARGHLTQRREQMAGQTDCTANVADLVTSYARDSALRLTQLTRPDGSCMIYEYDTRGRLSKTKRRDDCNAASSGDREEYTYSDDGLITKIETFDSAGTVKKRQELTYRDSRRLEKMINPVNTAKWTGFEYDARGLLDNITALDGATNLSKTQWTYDAESRVASEKRYTAGSSFDTWNLLFDWIGNQKQVTDGDSKVTTSTRDDLGRVVQLASPDLGGFPTVNNYDQANRLTTQRETYGGAGVKTHTFTFDNINRPLNSDYNGQCQNTATGAMINVPDIVRVYDNLTGAPPCPLGMVCGNLVGRLAYVRVKLMCTTAAGPDGDYTLEQETWFGYDAAGRLIGEYIKDDNGRLAQQYYVWTKNGALKEVGLPSGTLVGSTFGSAGSNSDTDRIVALWRTNTATPVIDNVLYEPYGPFRQYNQMNSISGTALRTRVARNLAYRQTLNIVEKQDGTSPQHSVTLSEDAKGRITMRDYFPSDPTIAGRYDSHFKYDLQDRVLCENTDGAASCPTIGATLKNNHSATPPFMAAGDWKTLLRPIPGIAGVTHMFTLNTGTHQVSTVNQTTLGNTSISYDSRGNRSLDNNTSGLTDDDRTYSYDDRRNVTNVRGRYKTAGTWRWYNVASSFDAKNRRVFKSFYDETTAKTATWFFYYDALDRLVEVRYTPDISVSATYQLFQLFWLGDRLVAYWQTDLPSTTTSKRYVSTDEAGRPVDMMDWPASGSATRAWSINPDAWGADTVLVGATVFQPILFAGQYKDDETIAWQNDGTTRHRPGVVLNGFRTYDRWVGAYLQVDPLVDSTWSSYVYVDSDPIGKSDPDGRNWVLDLSGDLWYCKDTGSQKIDDDGNIVVEAGGCHFMKGATRTDPFGPLGPFGPFGPNGPGGGGGGGNNADDPIDNKCDYSEQFNTCKEELDAESCNSCCHIMYDHNMMCCEKVEGGAAQGICVTDALAEVTACVALCTLKTGGPANWINVFER